MQAPALQQPLGQLAASHTQAPPEHRWPEAHGLPAPHWQPVLVQRSEVAPQVKQAEPPMPHWLAVAGLTQALLAQQPAPHDPALQTHAPPTHAWPGAQAAFAPHLQAPAVHESAVTLSHAAQVTPPVPQAVTVALLVHMPF
jgi:hypothetical protein